jgi:hypothetical protein
MPDTQTAVHPHHQPVSKDLRMKVYELLADSLIEGLEHPDPDEFSLKDSEDSAEMIATTLDQLKTRHELISFLKQLADKWKVYQPAYTHLVPVHIVLSEKELQNAFDKAKTGNPGHVGITVEWRKREGDKVEHITLNEAVERLKQMSS